MMVLNVCMLLLSLLLGETLLRIEAMSLGDLQGSFCHLLFYDVFL